MPDDPAPGRDADALSRLPLSGRGAGLVSHEKRRSARQAECSRREFPCERHRRPKSCRSGEPIPVLSECASARGGRGSSLSARTRSSATPRAAAGAGTLAMARGQAGERSPPTGRRPNLPVERAGPGRCSGYSTPGRHLESSASRGCCWISPPSRQCRERGENSGKCIDADEKRRK